MCQQLDNKYIKQLETAVSKSAYVGQGKKLKVKNKVCNSSLKRVFFFSSKTHSKQVNPDIMGGLVVEIGDQTIDKSVSSKVARLNKMLTDTL